MEADLHICRGTNVRYQARARWYGCRKYVMLGQKTRSKKVAFRRLAEAMAIGRYKRGDVLLIADYYDPSVIAETVIP